MRSILIIIAMFVGWQNVAAQTRQPLFDSLSYRAELQTTLAAGDHNPLWLNANRYGLSSLKRANGYVRGAIARPLQADSARRWGMGYAVDAAIAAGNTSTLIVQQAFVEGRWLRGLLTLGAKEQPMELKNQQLSSGSQAFGINARPIPQLRLSLPDYWEIPYTRRWLAVKGHIAYGIPTDDRWQRHFTHSRSRYTEHALYHSKAAYLRIGASNITLELGLEMAAQFGGTSHLLGNSDETVYHNGASPRSFFNALVPGGADATDSHWENSSGNHLGSWVGRLNVDKAKWNLGLYFDHYFEDHSAMFLLDYDGYGSGEKWDEKQKSRFFLYDLNDIMLGAELKLKQARWVNNIVVEYLYTKYQSGGGYHDHTINISDHISGCDNYYNHTLYTGWQHWGMVMGNPLYRSPLYNSGEIQVKNNRFVAWHLGWSGQLLPSLSYRVLATWQRGYGTYDEMLPDPAENVSLMAEALYQLPKKDWSVKAAIGMDKGKLMGDNVGLQLTIAKSGILKWKK